MANREIHHDRGPELRSDFFRSSNKIAGQKQRATIVEKCKGVLMESVDCAYRIK